MRYGLLGRTLGHSFSPEIHKWLWDAEYGLFPMEEAQARAFLLSRSFDGLNVTIPYKRLALECCDEVDAEAMQIGAVNTVINRAGRLFGFNTDVYGLRTAMAAAGISVAGKHVLVFGSGGTSRTAVYAAESLGAASVTVISRNGEHNYENLYSRHADAEVLINTTPVGMFPDCGGQITDVSRFPRCCGVMDAVYNPLRTRLTEQARQLGIPASGGLTMLVYQARRAAELFSGREISDAAAEDTLIRLRRERSNLVLIGMPGSVKTTVGRLLAEKLSMPFFDSDLCLEAETGVPAGELLLQGGEAAFREREAAVIARLACGHGQVISVGGGAVLREENRLALRQNGLVCYLQRPLDALSTEGRPLSKDGRALSALFAEREGLYRMTQDFSVMNVGSPEETAEKIMEAWNQ